VVELIGWESSILTLSLDMKQETTRNCIDFIAQIRAKRH